MPLSIQRPLSLNGTFWPLPFLLNWPKSPHRLGLSQKSVTRLLFGYLSSTVMSIFAISCHTFEITLYTPGHLEIIWELFAKKSAEVLSFRNSFITISSSTNDFTIKKPSRKGKHLTTGSCNRYISCLVLLKNQNYEPAKSTSWWRRITIVANRDFLVFGFLVLGKIFIK